MNNKAVLDIELDVVLRDIASYSLSDEAKRYVSPDLFTTDENVLRDRYLKIDDLVNKLEGAEPLEFFPSLSEIFKYVKETHRDIEGKDIYSIGEFLHATLTLYKFLEKDLDPIYIDLEEKILSSLNSEGDVNENHPRLLPLIKRRDEIKNERYRFSLSFISSNRNIVQNENPLYRNERVVIPIYSKDKKSDEYYISGQSSSGNTTFVEPFKLVELNNNVVLAEERIRVEKLKIVHELSEECRNIISFLKEMTETVVDFSFHYVFALWVRRVKANHIERSEDISLIESRHPLIKEKCVPISVRIEKDKKVLVLSGANCGGKTVTMKTIALMVALNQISSFIPASPLSTLPYFDNILTDIGDGQSIEAEKSTFSSHMSNIASICAGLTNSSLILLDELGSGTDPEEGAVLSLSVLKYLANRGRLTICTSHYNQVKNFAYTEKNMMNASMEFDNKTSLPTFKVLENIPGDSHALSTARRAKVPKEIIDDALLSLGEEKNTSANIITSLLSKSRTLDRKISECHREKQSLEEERKKLEKREEELKKELLNVEKSGYRELNSYLRESRKELENLVKLVKTGTLDKEKTKSVKNFISKLEKKEDDVKKDIEKKEEEAEDDYSSREPFKSGDEVLCGSDKTHALILSLSDKSAYVLFDNGLKMNVKLSSLVHAKKKIEKEEASVSSFTSSIKKPKLTLDCRGKTLSETIEMIDDEIESALLSSLFMFSIIHGYGDGILQRGVHEYLKKNKFVADYRFALPEDGGMGKTYVFLKKD